VHVGGGVFGAEAEILLVAGLTVVLVQTTAASPTKWALGMWKPAHAKPASAGPNHSQSRRPSKIFGFRAKDASPYICPRAHRTTRRQSPPRFPLSVPTTLQLQSK